MYNEEQKQRFIRNAAASIHKSETALTAFGYTEQMERSLGRDVCTFNADELQTVLDEKFALRTQTKIDQWSALRDYIRWCVVSGIDGAQDCTERVHMLGLDKARIRMVASPMHLQVVLDTIFDKDADETVDNANRLFCWLAYAGLTGDETVLLRTKDVDLSENSVTTPERGKFYLPKEAAKSLENCVKLTEFRYKHPLYEEKTLQRYGGDQLLRGIRAEARSEQLRYNVSIHMRSAYNSGKSKTRASFETISLSGYFYRIFEQERAGIEPNFLAVATEMLEADGFGTEEKPIKRKVVMDKSRLLQKDYQIWKLAFSV